MNNSDRRRPVDIDTSLVECIVVAVPDAGSVADLAAALAGLAESGSIRILDVVAVTRSRSTREVSVLEFEDLDDTARSLVDQPAGSLLSENDIERASAALFPGSAAVLVLIEDRWAEVLSSAAQRVGGRVIGGSRIPRSRIEAAMAEPPWRHPRSGGFTR